MSTRAPLRAPESVSAHTSAPPEVLSLGNAQPRLGPQTDSRPLREEEHSSAHVSPIYSMDFRTTTRENEHRPSHAPTVNTSNTVSQVRHSRNDARKSNLDPTVGEAHQAPATPFDTAASDEARTSTATVLHNVPEPQSSTHRYPSNDWEPLPVDSPSQHAPSGVTGSSSTPTLETWRSRLADVQVDLQRRREERLALEKELNAVRRSMEEAQAAQLSRNTEYREKSESLHKLLHAEEMRRAREEARLRHYEGLKAQLEAQYQSLHQKAQNILEREHAVEVREQQRADEQAQQVQKLREHVQALENRLQVVQSEIQEKFPEGYPAAPPATTPITVLDDSCSPRSHVLRQPVSLSKQRLKKHGKRPKESRGCSQEAESDPSPRSSQLEKNIPASVGSDPHVTLEEYERRKQALQDATERTQKDISEQTKATEQLHHDVRKMAREFYHTRSMLQKQWGALLGQLESIRLP